MTENEVLPSDTIVAGEAPTEPEEAAEILNDGNTDAIQPTAETATTAIDEAAPKRKPRGRPPPREGETEALHPRLRDKTTCPKCNKQLSVHALYYTHGKVCPANKSQPELVIEEVGAKEKAAPKAKAKAKPDMQVTKTSGAVDVMREYAEIAEPSRASTGDEHSMHSTVMNYIKEIKHKHIVEKQQRYKSLLQGKI